ncbi:paired amphipathic helix protein Sin3-like 4 [Iris pallida]|uniref:Paired amphipathic helix protein Sin3-like 4 n=1 Tax=Iris pallida TaxID=29817 RepID=A0AAX6GC55_IRIPA|nr:paired amphipathic helix protein Sin3-like 4 [Iris pallida]
MNSRRGEEENGHANGSGRLVMKNRFKVMAAHTSSEEDDTDEVAQRSRDVNVLSTSAATPISSEYLSEYSDSYLSAVKGFLEHKGKVEEFDELIDLLVDYGNHRIGIDRLLTGVCELLEGNRILIWGFNTFLPEGYKISTLKKAKHLVVDDATDFLKKVKERSDQYDPEMYKNCLRLVTRSHSENEFLIYREILFVFQDNYDLLDEFGNFLPDPSNAMAGQTLSEEDDTDEIATRSLDVNVSSTSNTHLSGEYLSEYSDTYLLAVKGVLQLKGKESKFDELIDLMVDYRDHRIHIDRFLTNVRELLKWHPVLIWGFDTFLPEGYKIAPMRTNHLLVRDEVITFVNKVKERFQDDQEMYKYFLGVLKKSRSEIESLIDFYEEILFVFEDNYDLLDEFGNFLPDPSTEERRDSYNEAMIQRLADAW